MGREHSDDRRERHRGDTYEDLADAVGRGAIEGAGELDEAGCREFYVLELERWDAMVAKLLLQIVADAGSARAAAKLLGVPRSTLSGRVRRARKSRQQ